MHLNPSGRSLPTLPQHMLLPQGDLALLQSLLLLSAVIGDWEGAAYQSPITPEASGQTIETPASSLPDSVVANYCSTTRLALVDILEGSRLSLASILGRLFVQDAR